MELVRQKNAATYIVFPIVDGDGDPISSATGLDSEIDQWSDGAAPSGFADCTNEAAEIGSTGYYSLSLTQTEMNQDYIAVKVTSTSSGAVPQFLLIRTMVGDVLLLGTNSSGNAIDVESTGEVGLNFDNIKDATGAHTLTNVTVPVVSDLTALTEAQTELASIPATTGSLQTMLQYVFQYFRNKKTVTETTETIFKEDAATSLGTAALSDNGTTFTRGEMS